MCWPGPPDTLFHYVSSLRLATIALLIIVAQFASIPLRLLLPPLIPLIILCSSKSPFASPQAHCRYFSFAGLTPLSHVNDVMHNVCNHLPINHTLTVVAYYYL